jgi:hypothetical protein
MPDPKPTDPPTPDPTEDDQREAKFWETLDGHIDGRLDAMIERHRKTSPARTGRTTLPTLFADMIFGAPKD